MSRTNRARKSRRWGEHTLEGEIARAIDYAKRYPTKWKLVRREKEVYEKELREAQKEYDAAVKANFGSAMTPCSGYRYDWQKREYTYQYWYEWIRPRHVSPWDRVETEYTIEEAVEEAKVAWAKHTRDGHWNETGRNTGFKKKAARTVRRANKRFCEKVMHDLDWEDDPYPTRKLGKTHVWDFW